jgi:endoglucanase
VDAVIERDMYVIVNAHHDSTSWADLGATDANYTAIEEQFYRLWYQIGTTLGCKSELLALEPINEPSSATNATYTELATLQNLFIQALNDSGGFNSQRVVTLAGPGVSYLQSAPVVANID